MTEKNYSITFKKSPYNSEFYQCQLRFKLEDEVPLKAILEALRQVNQVKLRKAWQSTGVAIYVKKGYLLGNVGEDQYDKYLAILARQTPS